MPDSDAEALYHHPTTGKLEWRYRYCAKRYTLNGGTRVIKLHLISAYDISESSPRQQYIIQRQRTIEKLLPLEKRTPERDGLLILIPPWIMVSITL
jgi:hypothetical protein